MESNPGPRRTLRFLERIRLAPTFTLFPLLALGELLHSVSHGFQASHRLFKIAIVATRTLSWLAGLLVGSLRLLELIAQIVQRGLDFFVADIGVQGRDANVLIGRDLKLRHDFE